MMTKEVLLLLLNLLLPFILSTKASFEGKILAFRKFNSDFISESYSIPPSKNDLIKHQSLEDDLRGFSLTCTTCVGRNRLLFERDSIEVYVVLSDEALSVIQIETSDENLSTVTQVVELDKECIPSHLMPFHYSNDEFAVVCTGLNLQFALLDSERQVTLHRLVQAGNGADGILLETDSQVKSVTYIADNFIEVYTVNTAEVEQTRLPESINCLASTPATLYSLHGQDKFLVSCTTNDGPTLYVVPINPDENVRSIEVEGHPFSSPNGTYIAVVNESRVTIYVTADSNIHGKIYQLPSEISKLEFLDSQNVLIFTRNDEHFTLDISDASKKLRHLPGGVPASWVWENSSNHYAFVTQTSTLYVFNNTSTNALYDPKPIANLPEMLVFIKKYVAPSTEPTNDGTPQSPPIRDQQEPSGGSSDFGVILGSSIGGAVLIILIVITGVIFIKMKLRNERQRERRLEQQQARKNNPITQEEEIGELNTALVVTSNGGGNQSTSGESNSNSASTTASDRESVSARSSNWLNHHPVPPSGANSAPATGFNSAPASGPNHVHTAPASAESSRQPILDETEHNKAPLLQNKETDPERQAGQIHLYEFQSKDQHSPKKTPSPPRLLPQLSPRSPSHYTRLQDPVPRSKPGPDFMPFNKEAPSYVHKTSTDPSAIGRPQDEENTSLIHVDF